MEQVLISPTVSSLEERKILIENLDLGPIKFKLHNKAHGLGWSIEKVNEVEVWYKRFLFLNLKYPKASIVPNKEIDEFWHTHILDTSKYYEDCQNTFGYFLHHFPYFGMRNEQDAAELNSSYKRTLELYELEFAAKPSDIGAEDCANVCTTPCEGGQDDPTRTIRPSLN